MKVLKKFMYQLKEHGRKEKYAQINSDIGDEKEISFFEKECESQFSIYNIYISELELESVLTPHSL